MIRNKTFLLGAISRELKNVIYRSKGVTGTLSSLIRSASALACETDCWKCKFRHNCKLFCPGCSTIQCADCTSQKLSYFRLLDSNETYRINEKKLKSFYIDLQAMLHPDKFVNTSGTEQEYSTSQSALVNEAYQTLADPVQRGLHLLQINGYDIDESTIHNDMAMLNDVFELNFEVDETEDKQHLDDLLHRVKERIHKIITDVEKNFQEERYTDARDGLLTVKYLYNVKNKIDDKALNLE